MGKNTEKFCDTASPKKPVINALISIDGKIPLFLRSNNGESWYDLPGGKPEPEDKNHNDTILREITEELGIRARVLKNAPVYVMQHPHLPDTSKVFITCAYVSGTPVNSLPQEHNALVLVDPPEAIALLGDRISDDVRDALRKINDIPAARAAAPRRQQISTLSN